MLYQTLNLIQVAEGRDLVTITKPHEETPPTRKAGHENALTRNRECGSVAEPKTQILQQREYIAEKTSQKQGLTTKQPSSTPHDTDPLRW